MPDPFHDTPPDTCDDLEITIDPNTGKVYQAGTVEGGGQWVEDLRIGAERSLFIFTKYIMGYPLLTERLHRGVCDWLQIVPPRKKLLILPRGHLKTTIVSQSLPLHVLVQPIERNIYFPGCYDKTCCYLRRTEGQGRECNDPLHRHPGCNTRVLIAGETDDNASNNLGMIKVALEGGNPLLRALWPWLWWDNPGRDAKNWNSQQLTIRRQQDFAQPSIDAAGVGTATTGRHYDIQIYDDVCSKKAAESVSVMEDTKRWMRLARMMLDNPFNSLEWAIGTFWTVGDAYQDMLRDKKEPVAAMIRAIIENGECIFPEGGYDENRIEALKEEHGAQFYLQYMSQPTHAELVDFGPNDYRPFEIVGDDLLFRGDPRDAKLLGIYGPLASRNAAVSGPSTLPPGPEQRDFGRDAYLRLKYHDRSPLHPAGCACSRCNDGRIPASPYHRPYMDSVS